MTCGNVFPLLNTGKTPVPNTTLPERSGLIEKSPEGNNRNDQRLRKHDL